MVQLTLLSILWRGTERMRIITIQCGYGKVNTAA